MQRVTLELGGGANVQRLYNARIDCRNDIYGSVQVCFRDPGFPCIRKAPLHSRLTVADKSHRQPNKYLLALAQVRYSMRIPIKLAEIRALTHGSLLDSPSRRQGRDAREVSYSWMDQTLVPVSLLLYTHVLYSIVE